MGKKELEEQAVELMGILDENKEELKQILHRIKKTKSEWTALQKKYKKHKHDFLEDEEEEIVQQTTNKMDVDQDEEEENEQNEKEQNNEEQNIEEKEDEQAM